MDQGRLDEAEALVRNALAFYIEDKTEDSPEVARARLVLGRCLSRLGSPDEALRVLQQSRDFFSGDDPAYARDRAAVEAALEALGDRGV
jgi:tetratricopeptide (TPR) repeat protein